MKDRNDKVHVLMRELDMARTRCAALEEKYRACRESVEGLEEAEARYRVLIENSLTGMCVQQDERLVYVNQRFADLTGYTPEELLGKHIWDIVGPEHAELVKQRHMEGISGRQPIQQYEISIETRDGRKRQWAVWFSVIDHQGRPAILGTVVDSTELARARDALKESEQRFRALFETATDCIFIKDATLRYSHVNPAMAALLDRPQSEIVGRTDIDLFGKRIGKHLEKMDLRVLRGERLEVEHVRPVRGVPLTFHDIRLPLEDASGKTTGLYGISRNITDFKKGSSVRPHRGTSDSRSPAMRSVLEVARAAARRDGIVLLLGESGAGKDHLARYIHDHSPRSDGPFFTMKCAALSPEIAESELFGHEPGAFTGAVGRKRGLLELAEGGTLLLNEIGDLPLTLQAKLLTFLDTRSFTRVGGESLVAVNARLIAATNKDLEQYTREGRFREDLYYRINVLAIRVPPLRERREDVPVLAQEMLVALTGDMHVPALPVLDPASVKALRTYTWPGNVRELRNVLERALMLWEGGNLEVTVGRSDTRSDSVLEVRFPSSGGSLYDVADEVMRSLCVEALERTGGNKQAAARLLGISRNSLYRLLDRLGISAGCGTEANPRMPG